MAEIRMGRWDCLQCGARGILGAAVSCEQCGAPRPVDVVFYLPPEAEVVTDSAGLSQALAGADWVCSHCQAHNHAGISHCIACGNVFEPSGDDSLDVREYGPGEVPTTSAAASISPSSLTSHPTPAAPTARSGCLWGVLTRLVWGLAYGVELVLFLVVLAFCWRQIIERGEALPLAPVWAEREVAGEVLKPTLDRLNLLELEVPVEVVGYRWVRTIQVEQRVQREVQGENPPPGVQVLRQEQVEDGEEEVVDTSTTATREVQVVVGTQTVTRDVTSQVLTGTEPYVCGKIDLGNGFFQDKMCERPVYSTVTTQQQVEEPRYETRTETYQQPRTRTQVKYKTVSVWKERVWAPADPLLGSGDNREPTWAPVPVRDNHQREVGRSEQYVVKLKGIDGQVVEQELPLDRWLALPPPGQTLSLKVGALSPLVPDLAEGHP